MSDFGEGVEGIELGAGTVGGLISGFVEQGLSANQALKALREAGGAMGRSPFLSLYGQVRNAIGSQPNLAGLDYSAIPDAGVYTPWAAGTPGEYASVVQTYVRRVGSSDWEPRFTTYKTQGPHSPQEAIDFADSELTAGTPDYSDDVVGPGFVTSVNVLIGRPV